MSSPAQANLEREKAKVHRLALIADRCFGDAWSADTDGDQIHILTKRSTGERTVICTISPDALPDEVALITGALENTVLFLTLRRRAINALRLGQQQPNHGHRQDRLRDGDFAANAAILCNDPDFHRFLEMKDTEGAIYSAEHADAALKRVLRIKSKTQLNREARAQTAFIDLRSDFEAFKRKRGQA